MTRLVISLALFLGLGGCASPIEIAGSFVCLTGVCSSSETRLEAKGWLIPFDTLPCQDLSGTYANKGFIAAGENVDSLFRQFDHRTHRTEPNPIRIEFESFLEIPFFPIERVRIESQTELVGGRYQKLAAQPVTSIWKDTESFYKSASVILGQSNGLLIADLRGEDKRIYERFRLSLKSEFIGCNQGTLVIRTQYASGGSEGGRGSASRTERTYSKMPNGDLRFTLQRREWVNSRSLGLSDVERARKEYIVMFSAQH